MISAYLAQLDPRSVSEKHEDQRDFSNEVNNLVPNFHVNNTKPGCTEYDPEDNEYHWPRDDRTLQLSGHDGIEQQATGDNRDRNDIHHRFQSGFHHESTLYKRTPTTVMR